MKSILTIFIFLGVLTIFNLNSGNTNNYKKNIKSQDITSENIISQSSLTNNNANHRLNHCERNFLRIGAIVFDDYSKVSNLINYSLKIFTGNDEITYNHKNFSQLNIFLPTLTQSQKSIQSEFLLI